MGDDWSVSFCSWVKKKQEINVTLWRGKHFHSMGFCNCESVLFDRQVGLLIVVNLFFILQKSWSNSGVGE